MSMLAEAINYLNMGYSIIPLYSEKMVNRYSVSRDEITKKCKAPLINKWKEYQYRKPTIEEVNNWWGHNPNANIGIITGKISDIIVFDIDSDVALEFANSKGGFPESPTVITGKGSHIYFKYPAFNVRNKSDRKIGLDIRGDGGYIVAPPSVHGSGVQYSWRKGHSIYEIPTEACSPWMVDYLQNNSVSDKTIIKAHQEDSLKKNDASSIDINEEDIRKLKLKDEIVSLITFGGKGKYSSRSEANQAVIINLIQKGKDENFVRSVFTKFPIGEKYREHSSPNKYLSCSFKNASDYLKRVEEDRKYSLTLDDCISYDSDRDVESLDIVTFQEYSSYTEKIIYLEGQFASYNGRNYEYKSHDQVNSICQKLLGPSRRLFRKSAFNEYVHYAAGDSPISGKQAEYDSVKYLNLDNGLFDLEEKSLIKHSPDIFTVNPLPYPFDQNAKCERWIQFLNEVFFDDQNKINLIQEAVGYGFHTQIPVPALFLLIGSGSNGKSVFLNTIASLFGDENTCHINLRDLGKEFYVIELSGKMVNIITETAKRDILSTDVVKAVVSGDWITGRIPHKTPIKFRPYSKHFIAMNEFPTINDLTHGLWRRLTIIDFPRVFRKEEMDVDLEKKLLLELPGIFNWSLDGLHRLKLNKFRFSEFESMATVKKRYMDYSNSAISFSDNHLASTSVEPLKEKYNEYTKYCSTFGYKPLKYMKFRRTLIEKGFLICNNTEASNQVYIFGSKAILPKAVKSKLNKKGAMFKHNQV